MAASANKIYQYVILALIIYAFAYPFISLMLKPLMPGDGIACYYYGLTGRPCPFCGTTRALRAYYTQGAALPLPLVVGLWCAGIEMVRKVGLCIAYAYRERLPRWVLVTDGLLTAAGVACMGAVFMIKSV